MEAKKTFTLAWIPFSLTASPRVLTYKDAKTGELMAFEPIEEEDENLSGVYFYKDLPFHYAFRILSRQMDRFVLIGEDKSIRINIKEGELSERTVKVVGVSPEDVKATIEDRFSNFEAMKQSRYKQEVEKMKAKLPDVDITLKKEQVISGGTSLTKKAEPKKPEQPKKASPKKGAAKKAVAKKIEKNQASEPKDDSDLEAELIDFDEDIIEMPDDNELNDDSDI